ncbi:MAG TPA: hypothetical protein VGB32_01530 [Candidatus Bathyarchaeia archaeon]
MMFGDLSSEVIHCPNCKEDVPKTLYCLNCGYPLYKIEQKKTEMVEPEPETLEVVAPKEEVDMGVEIERPAEPPVLEEEPAPEAERAEVKVTVIEAEEVSLDVEEPEEEAIEEPEPLEATVEPEPEAEYKLDEEPQTDIVEEQVEPEEEVLEEPPEEPTVEAVEPEPEVYEEPAPEPTPIPITIKMEPEEMEDIRVEFAPDPLTKEVMDNLAKNITLKIRLVKLLKDNQVKEETFKKLFDSYVEQGKIWVSRRDEIIKRFKADIDRMENALVTARKDHELLEIRKSIGDADDEEYIVKAPAYKWDIEHLDKEIKNRKGGIVYVADLKTMVPEVEVHELTRMAETDFGELDTIKNVSSDTIASMKETLTEALNSLQS